MPHQYMYSPTTPTYSPSYRPAYSFAPKGKVTHMHHALFHASWIAGLIVLLFSIHFTRIAASPMYAQQMMQKHPQLVMFLQQTSGKVTIAFMYLVSLSLFTGTYKLYMDKIRHAL